MADYDEPVLTDRDQPPIKIPYLTSIEHAIWDNMTRVRDYWSRIKFMSTGGRILEAEGY